MSQAYNEDETRVDFIDPFFEALGWAVQDKAGYIDLYRDVVRGRTIETGGAPDYSFRIGGVTKFFVEAKKPSVNLREAGNPAYQLRRYAWSAKLPLSILTNFREFAIYDCRIKPSFSDRASTGRIKYITYDEYPKRWDEIAEQFSKEAIMRGSFEAFVRSEKGKRGTAEVDDEFLREMESWRELLARDIAFHNKDLSVRELNFAVQMILDRIVFLRICEDRGIEPLGQIKGLLEGKNTYARLLKIYRRADERYNSGLFHFSREKGRRDPDELTPKLIISSKTLSIIIKSLYYPHSPYEFSVVSADILGGVYERFLGKIITLTSGHRARVEEKPEVKKAGGVYYTPSYIVNYIVKNTVGKLCEGKTPRQIEKLRVLDPACGSGSFLLGAYTFLLNYHRDWYLKDGPEKHNRKIYQGDRGEWFLTTQEKKRILLNNIFGVDIDSQAVEVAKLNLLLKVLEGENQETLKKQLKLFRERALPDLDKNIKCGNSLIGTDFLADHPEMSDEETKRVNPFDWETAFPEVFAEGGFDAVIGNPPYVRVRIFKELNPQQAAYLESHYRCAKHVWDVFLLFYEQAIRLVRQGGRTAFILPIQVLHQPNCESLRNILVNETSIVSVVDLSRIKIFSGATVKNCILVCEKEKRSKNMVELWHPTLPDQIFRPPIRKWPQKDILENPSHSLKIDLLGPKKHLCERLRMNSWNLGDLYYATFGLRSCAKGKGKGGKERLITTDSDAPNAKPYLEGRDIERYATHPTGRFIRYIPSEMYSPRTPELFEHEKIISQSMLSRAQLIATLDSSGYYVEQSLVCIVPHGVLTEKAPPATLPLKFLLGVINSRLESFYFSTYIIDYSLGGGLIHATPGSHAKLIIPKSPPDSKVKLVVSLVEKMLDLHKQLAEARTPNEKERLQRQIDATDREIDALVYELYGLTEEEIRIVEEGTGR